jgi:hypothetical protein
MIRQTIYLLIVVSFVACSKDKEPLELSSAEAFAFSLEPGWELNASVRVKNFIQEKEGDIYQVKLSYNIDLLLPSGERIENIDTGIIDESSEEEMQDLPIEMQLELTDAYKLGTYSLIFSVTDDYTSENDTLVKPFILSAD